jgi:Restriction endonuclease AspBHI N-terminal/Restriction endonuclease
LGQGQGVSNQGGFRILGSYTVPRLIVLTTSRADPNWPDKLDVETGRFTYYGDNKNPGHDLHGTSRKGNELLRLIYDKYHSVKRHEVPPIFVFGSTGEYRDVRFLGLAVPGAKGISFSEDLVAVWKSKDGKRFQNYRAFLTILDASKIPREWIRRLIDGTSGDGLQTLAPSALLDWQNHGKFAALSAPPTLEIRSKSEQLAELKSHQTLVQNIYDYFKDYPTRFEYCASRITEMMLGAVRQIDVTRPTRDGGRDALGLFRIGNALTGIDLEFAMEAKCYAPQQGVGVKEVSRLISRLRHRQFGVLVTTSFLAAQAYQEIKDDKHPIVVISSRDIAEILVENGLGELSALSNWLKQFQEA